jgi:hypothetical protein
VIKFAGDAIIVVWEGDEQELKSTSCVPPVRLLELQQKAGEHAVDGTKHSVPHPLWTVLRSHSGRTSKLRSTQICT